MMKNAQHNRLIWMTLLLVIAFCGLGWRLVDLQYIDATASRRERDERNVAEYKLMPWRGEIRDRTGEPLAISIRHHEIGVDPSILGPFRTNLAEAIGPILGMDVEALEKKIRPRQFVRDGVPKDVQYVPIKKHVSHERYLAMLEAQRNLLIDKSRDEIGRTNWAKLVRVRNYGARSETEVQRRDYPNGTLAAPTLGLVNQSDHGTDGQARPPHGVGGIEQTFNTMLAGQPGYKRVNYTELMAHVEEHIPARDGYNVFTTINRQIQENAEIELVRALEESGGKKAFAIVMDVNNFDILAVVNAPTFDPNDRGTYTPDLARSWSFTEVFEPGSVVKVVPIAMALEHGTATMQTEYFCENQLWVHPFGGKPLTDTKPYAMLSMSDILKKSSNIGTAKIAIDLGFRRIYDSLVLYGVGQKTGVGLYEEAGLLAPYSMMRPVDFTRLPIGYRSAMTQLQMACMHSAIANGGVLMQPRIVDRVEDRSGNVVYEYQPRVLRRVNSEATSRAVLKSLGTVTEQGGTAPQAATKYYTVAGKTGTARVAKNGGYSNKYISSFVGVFPASAPRICIAITITEPEGPLYYGGYVAGPAFSRIAEATARILNIVPDKVPEEESELYAADERNGR